MCESSSFAYFGKMVPRFLGQPILAEGETISMFKETTSTSIPVMLMDDITKELILQATHRSFSSHFIEKEFKYIAFVTRCLLIKVIYSKCWKTCLFSAFFLLSLNIRTRSQNMVLLLKSCRM